MSDIVDPDWPDHLDRHFADFTAIRRETAIRAGTIPPDTEDECRQAAEGPVAHPLHLDAFKTPVWGTPK